MGKKDRKNKKNKDDFSVNPFKALKGFAVDKGEKASPVPDKRSERPPGEGRKEVDDADLFARQMKQLGVEAMEEDERQSAPLPPPASSRSATKPKAPQNDEELFRQALGNMDVCFRDEIPEEDEPLSAPQPRRMKQVRRGTLRPEARLDLHGLTRREAVQKVGFFLQDCVHQGLQTVLLITGRGYGSEEGPVLRPEVEKYLNAEGRIWAAEWGRAPKRFGGEGALVVFLKSRRPDSET